MDIAKSTIFNITTRQEFIKKTLAIFNYQAIHNEVYKKYIKALGVHVNQVCDLEQIPFLPISFFKTHQVFCNDSSMEQATTFKSSGTTNTNNVSTHYVTDISLYENSYLKGFKQFYGEINDYCILALLPSYLERGNSSLVYMVNDLIKKSEHPKSGFFLNNMNELTETIIQLVQRKHKFILIGVSYALLDLIDFANSNNISFSLQNNIVMETGGMKGKRKEMVREELHSVLCAGFNVPAIHSEYGMTELLSQAYSPGKGIFECPPWMQIMIRDTNDPFTYLKQGKTGGINIIDLANMNSCSFIETQDLGKLHTNNSFEVLGRFDNSDIRGCNLMVQ